MSSQKRNLSEVFTMAQPSGEGWRHFQTINTMFKNGELKDQKFKASDIVKKGMPIIKQCQFKSLCSLSSEDRDFLLDKVRDA